MERLKIDLDSKDYKDGHRSTSRIVREALKNGDTVELLPRTATDNVNWYYGCRDAYFTLIKKWYEDKENPPKKREKAPKEEVSDFFQTKRYSTLRTRIR